MMQDFGARDGFDFAGREHERGGSIFTDAASIPPIQLTRHGRCERFALVWMDA